MCSVVITKGRGRPLGQFFVAPTGRMSNKQVPVYVNDTLVENTTITIIERDGRWSVNVIEAGRLMATLKVTVNSSINSFSVYEDRVVFTIK